MGKFEKIGEIRLKLDKNEKEIIETLENSGFAVAFVHKITGEAEYIILKEIQ